MLKAICLTEEQDFAKKNSEAISQALSGIKKAFEGYRESWQRMTENLVPALEIIKNKFSEIGQLFRAAFRGYKTAFIDDVSESSNDSNSFDSTVVDDGEFNIAGDIQNDFDEDSASENMSDI